MIVDLNTCGDRESNSVQKLSKWNKHALQSGDCLSDSKSAHWGAMQGYAEAIVEFFGEDEARRVLGKVLDQSPEKVQLAFQE